MKLSSPTNAALGTGAVTDGDDAPTATEGTGAGGERHGSEGGDELCVTAEWGPDGGTVRHECCPVDVHGLERHDRHTDDLRAGGKRWGERVGGGHSDGLRPQA